MFGSAQLRLVARPPTRGYRLRKFIRRNRTAVAVAASFAILIFIGVLGIVWQWREAVYQKSQAVAATAVAEKNFQTTLEQRMVALKALGQLVDVARNELPRLPATLDLQKKILKIADVSLKDITENPLVYVSLKDTTLAAAHASTGQLNETLGDYKSAADEYRLAEGIYQGILKTVPAGMEVDWNETVKQNLALVKEDLARITGALGSAAKAREYLNQAFELIGSTSKDAPESFRRNQANLFKLIGSNEGVNDPRKARQWYGDSLRLLEEIAKDYPSSGNSLELIKAYVLVGGADLRLRDPASCEKYYRLAVRVADAEVAKTKNIFWRKMLATSHERLGDFFPRTGKPAEAKAEYFPAMHIFQVIAKSDEKNVPAAADHSRLLYSLGLAEDRAGDKADAAVHFQASLEIREGRVKNKSDPIGERDLMVTLARANKPKQAIEIADSIYNRFGSDETEPDLDALRKRIDFKNLLSDLANKVK